MKPNEKAKHRKNFLPALLLSAGFWVAWCWLVFRTSPNSNLKLLAFYLLLFLATFLTSSLILANSRRGFLFALTIITILILYYYQLANPLNLLLLWATIITIEIYFKNVKKQP